MPVFLSWFSLVYHQDTALSFPPSYSILMYFIVCLIISFIWFFLAFISHTCFPVLHLVVLPQSSMELRCFPSYCFVLVYWFVHSFSIFIFLLFPFCQYVCLCLYLSPAPAGNFCFLARLISNLHWLPQFPFHPLTSNNSPFLHHATEDFSMHTLFP